MCGPIHPTDFTRTLVEFFGLSEVPEFQSTTTFHRVSRFRLYTRMQFIVFTSIPFAGPHTILVKTFCR